MSLPNEYLMLSWLGSTGTQYIDTEYKPNGNTEIDVSWYWNTDGTTQSRAMFGVDASWHINSFSQYCDRLLCYGNRLFKEDGSWTLGNNYFYYYPSGLHHLVFKDLHFNLNNSIQFDVEKLTFNSSYNLWLFAHNRAGKKESTGGTDRIKLYYCKIYESGTLVRDYVPCLRIADNKPGLYDLVNNKFYINKNAGADFSYEIDACKTYITDGSNLKENYKTIIMDSNQYYENTKSIIFTGA